MDSAEQKRNQAARVAEILKCMAHPARLMVVCLLLHGTRCARDITAHLQTTKSNASQHLKALMEGGILIREARGNRNFYSIADGNIRALIAFLERSYCPGGGLLNQEVNNDESERNPGCEIS